ncbi:MAG: flagellar basal body P-ring protein FlgI [Deferribacterota bacterium]|nr:flagellar basal body P-ring protein FlgI [Deferribacterota bacterium]
MKRLVILFFAFLIISNQLYAVKLKDLAKIRGVRDNQLIGYGLVVGLNGTGDQDQTEFTVHTLTNMLDRMGITVDEDDVRVDNVAAVMVTAKLTPFAKVGTKIDTVVSSIGDADSLEGGTLLLTPLSAPDGEVYAVAQGPITVGGLNINIRGANVRENHPTVGRIPNGAIVEKEVPYDLPKDNVIISFEKLSLNNIVKAKNAINKFFGEEIASIDSPTTISLNTPVNYKNNFYDFLDAAMRIDIEPEPSSKVVVDERTGTIVLGSDVRITTVAVAHGDLTIRISSNVLVSQPAPFSGGQTVVVGQPQVEVEEEEGKLMVIPEGAQISDLVKALNAIGATPRDLISILQSIDAAGALQGELEVI